MPRELLGVPVPPEDAVRDAEMTPDGAQLLRRSKRVRNDRIKEELGVRLIHPDYRAGLAALLRQETGEASTGIFAGA